MAATIRAGIYCRLSLARFGDTTKVDEQERICRELCEHRGWNVTDVYSDNNRSAWQRNRKRPGWDRMLADVDAGKLDAIVVYHGDRLARQSYDLEILINLAYGKGIRLASPTGVRDLSDDDDLFILRIEVAAQTRESGATSRRKKLQHERMRREGLVRSGGRGGRAFGFKSDGVTHIPAETAIIRQAAAAILAGHSTGTVARGLADAGITSPAGNPVSQPMLRKLLARPRYAGLMPDGHHKAAWQPVLERGDWETLQAVLDGRSRTACPAPSNAVRYLLSGIAVCGSCGRPLQIRQSKGRAGRPPQQGYGCVNRDCPRRVYRSQPHLDAYVTGRVVGYLRRQEFRDAQLPGDPGAAAELAALAARRDETEAAIEEYEGNPGRLRLLNRTLDRIEAREVAVKARIGEDGRARLLGAHAGTTREGFEGLPLGVRRALVQACYRVEVLPDVKRGPGFDVAGIRVTRA